MNTKQRLLTCVSLLLVSLAGCGATNAKFNPTVESARDAVDIALQAWKEGKPCKAIEEYDPPIQPIESRWQQGRKLLEFEIVDELDIEHSKQFKVKVKLEGALAPEETTYVVLGKEPLYVYWITDFEQSAKTM
jgi:hypothetical protein